MRILLAGLLVLGLTVGVRAQEPKAENSQPSSTEERSEPPEPAEEPEREEPIETDRDAFTPATKTVGKGRSILESAYSFIENRQDFEKHSFPEMIFRHGITERVELRLGWNYEVGGSGSGISGAQGLEGLEGAGVERESRMLYGFKAMLTEQNSWVPQSSILLHGQTPTSGKETNTNAIAGYVFGWRLPGDWKLDTAIRYSTAAEGDDHFSIWAPSTVLRIPLGERWGVHAEYFGLFSQQRSSDFVHHFFSPGISYLVNTNLEIGARAGWGLNHQSSRSFVNVGFGWRF